MHRILTGLLAFALLAVPASAQEKPAEALDKIKKELDEELKKNMVDSLDAARPILNKYAGRFLDLAEKNSKDPAALDALILVLRCSAGNMGKDTPGAKAVAVMIRDHVKSEAIARHLRSLAGSFEEGNAEILRAVIKDNPSRKIQGRAVKALRGSRKELAEMTRQLKDSAAERQQAEKQLGKEVVKKLIDEQPRFQKEAGELDKLLKEKYADVCPEVTVGKPAPEVESVDLDGKKVKLSDYKGKVVVVDIWATWCPPCRAMIPHSKKLTEKHKDKAFAFIGVSADDKPETVKEFMKKTPMPWTHWWNGPDGGIVDDWDVEGFPTVVVIDARGIVRNRFVGFVDRDLEEAVEKLLKEMEPKKEK